MASRIKIQFKDKLKYSPRIRSLRCRLAAVKDRAPSEDDPQAIARSIHNLCTAARNAASPQQLLQVEDRIRQRVAMLKSRSINWLEFESQADVRKINSATIIKPYVGPKEKGMLLISFDYQWARLMQHYGRETLLKLAERYDLCVCTVWAEPHCVMNYVLPVVWPGERIYATISDPNDEEIIPRFSEKYVVAPVLCSNWVDPAWYKPVPYEKKDVDFFMLANFGEYKRHWELFRALRDMPKHLKVVLIGTHNGKRDDETIRQEAKAFGIGPDRFVIRRSPPHAEVRDTLARAKTSLIFSLREGSCMAIVESMFANTPVGMFEDAKVGSRKFINEHTGRFLKHKDLAPQLMDFLENAPNYEPRKWVVDNKVDCRGSSDTLNRVIRDAQLKAGQEWTQDTLPHMWDPHPTLVNADDKPKVEADYAYIENEIGIDLNGYPG
ncbi:MAG: hypothetical protein ACI9OD_001602 [Limisphaerales bacterium]|jgi:hypothetical protein